MQQYHIGLIKNANASSLFGLDSRLLVYSFSFFCFRVAVTA